MTYSYRFIFNALQDAILDKRSVTITYKNFQNNATKRDIFPLRFKMIERTKSFYDRLCIIAYCNLRKEERTFAIYRISYLTSNSSEN